MKDENGAFNVFDVWGIIVSLFCQDMTYFSGDLFCETLDVGEWADED